MRTGWIVVGLLAILGSAQLLYMTLMNLDDLGWMNGVTAAMVILGWFWIAKGAWIRARRDPRS
jgi:hypothetical protein